MILTKEKKSNVYRKESANQMTKALKKQLENKRASERNQEPERRLCDRDTRCHERYFLFLNSTKANYKTLAFKDCVGVAVLIPEVRKTLWVCGQAR